jgi:hypothetical protein
VPAGNHAPAPVPCKKDFCKFLIDRGCFERIYDVSAHLLRRDELRVVITQNGFHVKSLAALSRGDMRTLEWCFGEQFRMTPKAWISGIAFAKPIQDSGTHAHQTDRPVHDSVGELPV